MTKGADTMWRKGEDEAARYLGSIGHRIVARNWRYSHLELDIISLENGCLHIVEVKSRTVPSAEAPEYRVDKAKMKHMAAAAGAFLASREGKGLPRDLEVSFDVISVLTDGQSFEIEYYPQAFIPLYA